MAAADRFDPTRITSGREKSKAAGRPKKLPLPRVDNLLGDFSEQTGANFG